MLILCGGVNAFFVLSAFFLVQKQWMKETVDIKAQFQHRIHRLYPPYIVVILIAAVYAILRKRAPYDIISHLLSIQNFQWMITGYISAMQPMTAHTWTLSIEVWCGIVWLFLLRFVPKEHFKIAMWGMLLLGICYRVLMIFLKANVYVVSLCPIAYFDAFACGALLAVRVQEHINSQNNSIILIIGGLTGILISIAIIACNNQVSYLQGYQLLASPEKYLCNWFTGNIYFFITLLATGIIGLLILYDKSKVRQMGKVEKIFVMLGNFSYFLYLFHWPILFVVKKFTKEWVITFPVTFVGSVLMAIIFNKLYLKIKMMTTEGLGHDSII